MRSSATATIDQFLERQTHIAESRKVPPPNLLNNTKWDVLSRQMWDKFVQSQQTAEMLKQRVELFRNLGDFIKNVYPSCDLYLVGSTVSGFSVDSSDIDVCLVSNRYLKVGKLYRRIVAAGKFENICLIVAKVPILCFRDRVQGLQIDLNHNHFTGIKNTHLLYCYSQLDWRLRPLATIVKLWAKIQNINDPRNHTISSYSLVLMVIHFLQYGVTPCVLPCLHKMFPHKFPLMSRNEIGCIDMNETMQPYESQNRQTIGELFCNFLQYYTNFDYKKYAISVRTGGVLLVEVCRRATSRKKESRSWKELCIEEPFELTNTAHSVYYFTVFRHVKSVFATSYRTLQDTLDFNAVLRPM